MVMTRLLVRNFSFFHFSKYKNNVYFRVYFLRSRSQAQSLHSSLMKEKLRLSTNSRTMCVYPSVNIEYPGMNYKQLDGGWQNHNAEGYTDRTKPFRLRKNHCCLHFLLSLCLACLKNQKSMFQRLSLSDGLMLSLSCVVRKELINLFQISGFSLSITALLHVHFKLSLFSQYSLWTQFFLHYKICVFTWKFCDFLWSFFHPVIINNLSVLDHKIQTSSTSVFQRNSKMTQIVLNPVLPFCGFVNKLWVINLSPSFCSPPKLNE